MEVIRERYALAEKALWKAGLPVPTTPQKERPVAKGPAAADRSASAGPPTRAANASGQEGSQGEASHVEATPAEPPSSGAEPISAAAAQMPAQEVPGMRNGKDGEAEPVHH